MEHEVVSAGPAQPAAVVSPITFTTARSLYPVLALIVVASVAVAAALYRSKVGRALMCVKAEPDAHSRVAPWERGRLGQPRAEQRASHDGQADVG